MNMFVNDMLKLAKTQLHNIIISKDDEALLALINLGISELYRRFNLSIKAETVVINKHRTLYDLQNDDVSMLLSMYYATGKELRQPDVLDSTQYDYKIVNYKSFMLRVPFDGVLYAIYKANPIFLRDANDTIDLPDAMIDALLAYINYMGHNTINRDQGNDSSMYFQRFELACNHLESQGYKIPLSTERVSLQAKGFV